MSLTKEKENTALKTLGADFGFKNIFESPRIEKVVISVGVGKVNKDKARMELIPDRLAKIAGQKAAPRGAKKSIASFKLREGDTVDMTLTNPETNIHQHSIDLHAVTGPGGGSAVTSVNPGESKTFTFKALNQGLYVYHCATPNAANHMVHGMYGLILVEPEEGLPEVDHEFYVMQGELYSLGKLGRAGQECGQDCLLEKNH